VDIEEAGARLVSRFGPEAAGWLDEVPALAAQLASQRGLALGELFASGASSVVMRCQWPDGTPAVLKLSPDRALLTMQVEMLRVFASSGRVPAVLSADVEAGAMVLEEVRPGTEAGDLPQASLPPRWGELLSALHAVALPARRPWDLRGRCEEAFARIGRRLAEPAIGARIDQATWRRADRTLRGAARRCWRLSPGSCCTAICTSETSWTAARRAGWSRSTPKACIGDPCFDAVDYVVAGAGHEDVEVRCQRVATACGLDGDRLYAWSRVIAPMFAIAYLTYDGSEPAIDELVALAR